MNQVEGAALFRLIHFIPADKAGINHRLSAGSEEPVAEAQQAPVSGWRRDCQRADLLGRKQS